MTFLITGAGRGLGLEFTRQLLGKEQNVIAWVREPEKATELKTLAAKYSAQLTIQKVEITDQESISAAAANIKNPIDVLINNAGILIDAHEDFLSLSQKTIEQTFAVNVIAPIQVTQSLLPLLKKSASPLVVTVSSKMGSIDDNSSGGHYAYRMSKTAVNMFNKSFSVDFPNIKALVVHPGWVQTDMGGAGATTTQEQSIKGLLQVIANKDKYKSGDFVSFGGEVLRW